MRTDAITNRVPLTKQLTKRKQIESERLVLAQTNHLDEFGDLAFDLVVLSPRL